MKRKFAILFVCHAAHAGGLRLRRRGAFGYVFRFGFNGQHRKQIERKSSDRDG